MPSDDAALGGRLPLLPPAELDAEQTRLHQALVATMVPWAKKSGFQADLPDGRLIGPFNGFLYSPRIGQAFVDLLHAEQADTALPAAVREVVILSVGAVWRSAYELYAHRAVAQQQGLDPLVIDALATGRPPVGLTDEQAAAHAFATALAADHAVPADVYQRAVDHFGPKGVVDLVHLVGLYMATSALLNAAAVPAPAAG